MVRETPRGAAHASPTDELKGRLLRGLAIAAAASVLMAVAQAFGSGALPFAARLGYWLVLMAGGTLLGTAVTWMMETRGWLEDRPWLRSGATALAIAAPYTGVVWGVGALAFPAAALPGIGAYVVPVLVISAVMTAVNHLASRQPLETHLAAAGAAPPRFLDRAPPRLKGAELYAVEAEDHYLRLHTARGSDLILMRLSDAIAELEGLEGAQTHRSWWVAKEAVEGVRREGSRAVLQLKSGIEAPVSRSYLRALKDEGWF